MKFIQCVSAALWLWMGLSALSVSMSLREKEEFSSGIKWHISSLVFLVAFVCSVWWSK